MTYYEILEISENASEEVIKMAYKALAKKYHPDVFVGDAKDAEEKMKQINMAYSVLSDATKRAEYDSSLKNNKESDVKKENYSDANKNSQPSKPFRFKKGFVLVAIVAVVACISLYLILGNSKNIEQIKDSVVMVEIFNDEGDKIATGSGFCAYKENWIITNFHVIEGAHRISIITDDRQEISVDDIIFFNKKDDLAVLEISKNLKPLSLGNGNNIKTKDKITTIGSPKGELNTVSEGIISNVDTKNEIRISAPISHGSSGGVLLNNKYQVIGITSAGYDDAQNLNFAINISVLEQLYSKYKDNDRKMIIETTMSMYSGNFENFNNYMSSDTGCYTVPNIITFFHLTDSTTRFERLLSEYDYSWYSIYNNFSNKQKKQVVNLFLELNSSEFTDNNIAHDIDNWNTAEFFISLKVLEKYKYAITYIDVDNYSDKDLLFENVEDNYPLEAAEKSLILYLLGGYKWNEIHVDNKEDIFYYFDSKYGTSDLGAILETLGYEVVYENDGTLTGYW